MMEESRGRLPAKQTLLLILLPMLGIVCMLAGLSALCRRPACLSGRSAGTSFIFWSGDRSAGDVRSGVWRARATDSGAYPGGFGNWQRDDTGLGNVSGADEGERCGLRFAHFPFWSDWIYFAGGDFATGAISAVPRLGSTGAEGGRQDWNAETRNENAREVLQ
jgi:hypothetical protein